MLAYHSLLLSPTLDTGKLFKFYVTTTQLLPKAIQYPLVRRLKLHRAALDVSERWNSLGSPSNVTVTPRSSSWYISRYMGWSTCIPATFRLVPWLRIRVTVILLSNKGEVQTQDINCHLNYKQTVAYSCHYEEEYELQTKWKYYHYFLIVTECT